LFTSPRKGGGAYCTAIKLLLHAVSMVIDGPCQLKKYDILLDRMLRAEPVAAYVGMFSLSP
jgi:hypothetical protein